MVKSELINRISQKITGLPVKDIEASVQYIIDQLSHALSHGDRIEIRGFGSFSLHYRPSRVAHNPKNRSRVYTHAKYSPHFKPGKELRDRVNESRNHYQIKDLESEDNEEQTG